MILLAYTEHTIGFSVLTAIASGVCRWIMHLMSGLAWWMAEWSVKPALLIPNVVDPGSITSPCISILTSDDAVTSEYNTPNGFSKKCSCSWFILAYKINVKNI